MASAMSVAGIETGETMKNLTVIIARAGSKGLVGKNSLMVAGKKTVRGKDRTNPGSNKQDLHFA